MARLSAAARRTCTRVGAAVGPGALALVLAACGASSSSDSGSDLFREYLNPTNIEGDAFRGATSADRLAEFAAEGTPAQVRSALLAARPCGSNLKEATAGCRLEGPVAEEAAGFAGAGAKVYVRRVLVKRDGGRLEFFTLYVARRQDGTAELIDISGQGYPGGLDDFRRHNQQLTSDDQMLTLRDVTATPGRGEIVAVSGHTGGGWSASLITGVVAVLLAVGGGLFRARRRNRPYRDGSSAGH